MLTSTNFLILAGVALALAGSGLQGCKKNVDDQNLNTIISSCTLPPDAVTIVPLNKQGNNLLTTTSDQVVISYSDNGKTLTVPCTIAALTDETTQQPSSKYGGLGFYCNLGLLSNRQNNAQIKTFQFVVNNRAAGTIFYDLRDNPNRTSTGVQNCYKLFAFTVDGSVAQPDITLRYNAYILHCNL